MRALVLFALSFLVLAQGAYAQDPKMFVSKVADEALAIVKSGASEAIKRQKLEKVFVRTVDIPWVGRFVLGKHWRAANATQQKQYLKNYQKFVVANYTDRFGEYTGQDYEIRNIQDEADGDKLVTLALMADGQPPVITDFRIRKSGSSYKVVDIMVEGVSMITTQRSEFNSVVNRKGLDFLIEVLGKRS